MPLDTPNLCFSSVFAIVGFIGSATNLLVVLPNVRYLTRIVPSSFLVFWLCLFDSVAIVNGGIISASILAIGENDAVTCRLHAILSVFGNTSSILLCFGLALFRHLIVVHQTYLPKYFATFFVVGVVVFAALVSSLPFMMGSQEQTYKMRPCNVHCAPDWSQRDV
ncbi:hypothetical protein BJ741DRAFT_586582 [Chytriomyces cf. hyalinus JEL632]|nr:hypothetical protein BJ741DRAFT_586582 [Chytriomyces cf. hyalinus JEL632]